MKSNIAELFDATRGPETPSLTLRDAVSLLFKHKRMILGCLLAVACLVGALLHALPPSYVSEARVLVKTDQESGPVFYSGISAYREGRDNDPPNRKLETEVELLTVLPLSAQVVRAMGLRYDQVHHAPVTTLVEPLADAWEWIEVRWLGREAKERRSLDDTVREFNKSISAKVLKSKGADTTSNLLEVSLVAPDPQIAEQSLHLLLQSYVRYLSDINQRTGDNAMRIVTASVLDAETKVEEAQGRLNRFLAEKGIVLLRPGAAPRAPAAAADDDAAMRTAAAGGSAGARASAASEVAFGDDGVVLALKSRLTQAQLQLLEARLNFTEENSRVRDLRSQVAQLKQRVQAETRRSATNETGLMSLNRELRIAEEGYLEVKKRMTQIGLFLQLNPTQTEGRTIVDPARRPSESDWKAKTAFWLIACAAGLFLGLAGAGLLELADHRLQNATDVLRHLGLETLAMVNFAGARRRRDSQASMQHAALRLCAKLRREEGQRTAHGRAQIVLITSARAGEGKTAISRLLAQELAAVCGREVLLIDANLRNPELHREFGLPRDGGFADGLAGAGWDHVRLHEGPVPGLRIMTAGTQLTSQLRYRSEAVTAFWDHAGRQDAVVLIDGPCLSAGGMGFAERVDNILLVIDASHTRREVVTGVLDGLNVERHKLMGAILNNWTGYIPRFLYRFF
jgi:uncharacterized protein involved in exopolysaccharide biosynthesis/Mrp family chromosome partitioning ATPase